MHTITLSFSTLTELSAAVAKLAGADKAPEAATPASAKVTKLTDVTKTPADKAETKPAAEPAAAPAAAPAPKAAGVDYPTLQKAVFELAGLVQKKGLDSTEHVLAIAVKHGAPNFKGLVADVYAAALADVKAKIVEVAALEAEVA